MAWTRIPPAAVLQILEAAREAASNAPADVVTWIAGDDEKLSQFLATVEEGKTLRRSSEDPADCALQIYLQSLYLS